MLDYFTTAPELIRFINQQLVSALKLSGKYTDADPVLGSPYGLMVAQSLNGSSDSPKNFSEIQCQILVSGAFLDYWEAANYSVATAMQLDSFSYIIGYIIRDRGTSEMQLLFNDFIGSGKITIGQPRAPLKAPAIQSSNLWIVDIVGNFSLKLNIKKDEICGYK